MPMDKPGILLFVGIFLTSATSQPYNDQSTQIKNTLWTAIYSLSGINRTMDEWKLLCYKSLGTNGTESDENFTIEQCAHACIIKFTILPDPSKVGKYLNKTSYHCQDLDTYPPDYPHVCAVSDKIGYPILRTYFNKRTLHKTQLYCCNKNYCNEPSKWIPIEPQQFIQTEHKQMEDYDTALFLSACIILAGLTIWPFFKVWQVSREDKWLEIALNSRLERAVQLMEFKPRLAITRIKQPITGQLTFDELWPWLYAIKYYDTKYLPKKKITFPCQEVVEIRDHRAEGHGHKLVWTDRVNWVRYIDEVQHAGRGTLMAVLEHGPYAYDWKPIDLVELFDQAKELFHNDPILVDITLPVVVVGDIRGQYSDLWRWFYLHDVPPKTKFLFLGGLIDPHEPGSLDCLALISVMKLAFPRHIFFIRGVPESMTINFGSRYGPVNDSAVRSAATRLCSHLPIACRIHLRILAVHSGISHLLTDYESFDEVKRPFDLKDMPVLARQLIFNEPTTKVKMYRKNEDHIGNFGFQAVTRLCKEVGFDYIIRSRHHIENGVMWSEKGRLVSIWSAPGKIMKTFDKNGRELSELIRAKYGAVLRINDDGTQEVYRISAQRENTT